MKKKLLIKNEFDLLDESKTKVNLNTLRKIGYKIIHTYPDNISIAERINYNIKIPKILEILDEENIEWKTWKNKKDQIHRENSPALIYYRNNKIISKEWYLNNRNYSGFNDKASAIEFYENGTLKEMIWNNDKGYYHSSVHPAYFYYDFNNNTIKQTWYLNGVPTRSIDNLHLPTTIYIKNNKIIDFEYLINGYNKTKIIKEWLIENNYNIKNINKELFYINHIN